jgi:hypothetical protein
MDFFKTIVLRCNAFKKVYVSSEYEKEYPNYYSAFCGSSLQQRKKSGGYRYCSAAWWLPGQYLAGVY